MFGALCACAQRTARGREHQCGGVEHTIHDGGSDTDSVRGDAPERDGLRAQDGIRGPEHVARAYVMLRRQPRDAWTHGLDVRPWMEKF